MHATTSDNGRAMIRHRMEEMLRQFQREMLSEAQHYGHHFSEWERGQIKRLASETSRFAATISSSK